MGYQDRSYSRDGGGGSFNPLMWLLNGSVPLFRVFDIHVRAHAQLIVLYVLVLIGGLGPGFGVEDKFIFMPGLFVVILLHEFGHCFGARWMGGTANDVMLHPLGGLAFTMAPKRPLATFITVAAGPAVNVILLIIAGLTMLALGASISWNPWDFGVKHLSTNNWHLVRWVAWLFQLNYVLLLLNLLPAYPLDGGQMLQAVLWRPLGYYRSMVVTMQIGLAMAALMMIWGLMSGRLLLFWLALSNGVNCFNTLKQVQAIGPHGFQEEEADYSAAYWRPDQVEKKGWFVGRREKSAASRAAREAADEQAEQEKIDKILAKVSEKGMHSLNFLEKRALKQATERQRQRNLRGRR